MGVEQPHPVRVEQIKLLSLLNSPIKQCYSFLLSRKLQPQVKAVQANKWEQVVLVSLQTVAVHREVLCIMLLCTQVWLKEEKKGRWQRDGR